MSKKQKFVVSKADYERIAAFLRSVGAKVTAIEVTDSCVRVITGDAALTLGCASDNLDKELSDFRGKHGYS